MRIIFMGTPSFAVPSLKKLYKSSHKVCGVVTVPDCRKGRGLRIRPSPVKKAAEDLGIPVLQPDNLTDQEFLRNLKNFKADCFIIVGFCILPPVIYKMPPQGSVNLHASLLPKYRGAAPIQWAIINGEKRTGVTTFFLKKKVDTGNIILQESVKIEDDDTAGSLHDKLAILGAKVLLKTVDMIESGSISSKPQKGEPSRAPKIKTETGKINWQDSAENIVNLSRGLSPRPGVYCFWNGNRIKLFNAEKVETNKGIEKKSGTIVNVSPEGLDVSTGEGIVRFKVIQLEGKKRMDTCEFVKGTHISSGDQLK